MSNMRIILSMVLSAFIGCGVLSAQTPQSEPQQRKINPEELIQKRIDRLQESLVLDDQTAAKFAPLYKEYLQSLRKCYENCPYKKNSELTDADKEKRLEYQFECRQNVLNTQKQYYSKFKNILNASQLEKVFGHGQFNQGYKNYYNHCGRFYNNRKIRRGPNFPYCNASHYHRMYSRNWLRY